MLEQVKRRISALERSIRPPLTTDRFLASVEVHARLTGVSQEAAFRVLVATLSDEDLDGLIEESEQAAFGGDTAARDAALRKAGMLPKQTSCGGPDGINSNGDAKAECEHDAG